MSLHRFALPLIASLAASTLHAQAARDMHDMHADPRNASSTDAGADGASSQEDVERQHRHPEVQEHAAHARQPASDDDGRPPSGHVAPPPPQHGMESMTAAEMVEVMGMDDRARFGHVAFDRFEYVDAGDGHALAWSARASYGGDIDRFAVRSEGERANGSFEHADAELLWSHAIAPFWDSQVGVRRNFGDGPGRNWAAFGVHGLAPYWFEVGATAYLGEQGRTALRAEIEYELLLTQRLVLQPRLELNAYGRRDPAARIGAGLADAEVGLRLRYEIRREVAPYIGVERRQRFGASADYARADGNDPGDTQWVVGVRFWF
jgi:copper resistance protein B